MSGYCPNCTCGRCAALRQAEMDTRADRERSFAERLKSNRPNLPCCGPDGCTGGPSCWHDEPDNIPESWD
ncbi:hypothetical protein GCM10008956_15140 [Deinococcus arenae]|uniref:Uncharacterized protein n=1 Tax=Deinococcus arenae TaxID=1452751 RepID=A0A8H9L7I0_9DEIO|nr:hypothetical protein GCM10008956_15140 [Deinococcus arenae]